MTKVLNTLNRCPQWARVPLCFLFLVSSLAVWQLATTTATKVIFYIVFFLPVYICGEYLVEKMLPKAESLSVFRTGISPMRIVAGTGVVIGFIALVYGIWILLH